MYYETNDILYQAATVWKELTEYRYTFTYGYKKKLHSLNIIFSFEDFPHLAGFQYLKDLNLPKYNPGKTLERILDHTITHIHISKGIHYDEMVRPRLEAMTRLKDILENDFILFSFMPRMYPFTTKIQADFLISSHFNLVSYVFILQTSSSKNTPDYLCCSAFIQGERDYETNQRSRVILKKERLHLSSNTTTILFDRLTSNSNLNATKKPQ